MNDHSLSIPARFNGPLESGQGGYFAGVIAGSFEGPAEISLRSPVPLDSSLEVAREDDGSLRVLEGETLVAEAHTVPGLEIDVPAPVSLPEARDAATRYRGRADGMFSHCFVCGRARDDTLEVFAGAVEGRDVVASSWTPPAWTAGPDGSVREEIVWAVLDCPTYFALYTSGELPLSFLARISARIDGPIAAGTEHAVMAWPIETDGRKHHAGAAVLSGDGEILAAARALLIAPRDIAP